MIFNGGHDGDDGAEGLGLAVFFVPAATDGGGNYVVRDYGKGHRAHA